MTTHMMAGAVAGIMEHSIMYPLDSVKVSMPIEKMWQHNFVNQKFTTVFIAFNFVIKDIGLNVIDTF